MISPLSFIHEKAVLGKDVHVDDKLIKNYNMNTLHISVLEGMLEMVVKKTNS